MASYRSSCVKKASILKYQNFKICYLHSWHTVGFLCNHFRHGACQRYQLNGYSEDSGLKKIVITSCQINLGLQGFQRFLLYWIGWMKPCLFVFFQFFFFLSFFFFFFFTFLHLHFFHLLNLTVHCSTEFSFFGVNWSFKTCGGWLFFLSSKS